MPTDSSPCLHLNFQLKSQHSTKTLRLIKSETQLEYREFQRLSQHAALDDAERGSLNGNSLPNRCNFSRSLSQQEIKQNKREIAAP